MSQAQNNTNKDIISNASNKSDNAATIDNNDFNIAKVSSHTQLQKQTQTQIQIQIQVQNEAGIFDELDTAHNGTNINDTDNTIVCNGTNTVVMVNTASAVNTVNIDNDASSSSSSTNSTISGISNIASRAVDSDELLLRQIRNIHVITQEEVINRHQIMLQNTRFNRVQLQDFGSQLATEENANRRMNNVGNIINVDEYHRVFSMDAVMLRANARASKQNFENYERANNYD